MKLTTNLDLVSRVTIIENMHLLHLYVLLMGEEKPFAIAESTMK
jgi:hypothetical protein